MWLAQDIVLREVHGSAIHVRNCFLALIRRSYGMAAVRENVPDAFCRPPVNESEKMLYL
jgi:hypothetical protein